MHAYLIKYACTFILTYLKHCLEQKKNVCIYNKQAHIYTKCAQNGAFTDSTPYECTNGNYLRFVLILG